MLTSSVVTAVSTPDSSAISSSASSAISRLLELSPAALRAKMEARLWRTLPWHLCFLIASQLWGIVDSFLTRTPHSAFLLSLPATSLILVLSGVLVFRLRHAEYIAGVRYWILGALVYIALSSMLVLVVTHDTRVYGVVLMNILYASIALPSQSLFLGYVAFLMAMFVPTLPWWNADEQTVTIYIYLFWSLCSYLIVVGRTRYASKIDGLTWRDERLNIELQATVHRLQEEARERHTAESELRASEARYRSIFNNVVVGVFQCDPNGRFMLINSTLHRMMGYRSTDEFFADARRTENPQNPVLSLRERVIKVASRSSSSGTTLRLKQADGTPLTVILYARQLDGDDGHSAGIEGLVVNITERDAAEEKLRQQQERLAKASRIAALSEVFVAISHEVSQPLFAISNFANASLETMEHLDQTGLDDVVEWNRKIAAQAERGSEIIRRLRGLSRQSKPLRSNVPLSLVVYESLAMVQALLDELNVRVQICEDDPTLEVLVDPLLAEQALVNLLRNACDAMRDTDPSNRLLTIHVSEQEASGTTTISISDSGCGLPENGDSQLYDSFYTTKSDGLGIGLAVCRTVAKAHGGRVWATENQAGGAVFHMSFPTVLEASHDGD